MYVRMIIYNKLIKIRINGEKMLEMHDRCTHALQKFIILYEIQTELAGILVTRKNDKTPL